MGNPNDPRAQFHWLAKRLEGKYEKPDEGANGVGGAVLAGAVALATPGGAKGKADDAIKEGKSLLGLGQDAAARGPLVGGGATLEKLTAGEIKRIQNAANRAGAEISVVGSRVNPTKALHVGSDYDYVIQANAKTRNSLSGSLPGAKSVRDGTDRNLDFLDGPVRTNEPFVTFFPQ